MVKDPSGVPFYYGDGGDVWFPPFPLPYSYKEQLDVLRNTIIRDDDILMTSHAKSGSHWHYEILSMLARGSATYVKTDKPAEMMDRLTSQEVDGIPSPRLLSTHVPFRYFPKQAIEKKTKIVYLLRNPKDVAVSLHNHMRDWTAFGYPGSWPDFLQMFLDKGLWCNNWFDAVLAMEKEIEAHPEVPIYIAVYEEAVRDPVGHVIKLNDFLGLGRSHELCQQIAEACSFDKLKTASHEFKVELFKDKWAKGSPGFFRKGKVGDWKNWFTEEQNQQFDKIYSERMKGSKLNIIFEL